jgi:hypothetical protein
MSRTRYGLSAIVLLSILSFGVAFAQAPAPTQAAPAATSTPEKPKKVEGVKLKKELRAVCTEQAKGKKLTRAARTKFMDDCTGNNCQCGGSTPCNNRECYCECTGGQWIAGQGGCGRCAAAP